VMPLPVSHRLGMKMIQMPPEVLTLGIFSNKQAIIQQFPHIFQHPAFSSFRFIAYSGSPGSDGFSGIPNTITKQTQELKLKKCYPELQRGFSRSHRRNIRAFYETGGEITDHCDPDLFTDLLAKESAKRPEIFMASSYRNHFNLMAREATNRNNGRTFSVWKKGKPIAASFFLMGNNRVIPYHLANEEGQQLKASFALIDHFIHEHAGNNKILDFAGSSLPHVAEFNRRFGAKPVPYPAVTINRLPFFMRVAKEMKVWFKIKHLLGG